MSAPRSPLVERMRALTYELGGPGTRERLAKLTHHANEFGVDPYGLDIDAMIAIAAPALWLYRKYFRVQVFGIENVPATGRAFLVSNHSGQLPFDGVMIGLACLMEMDPPRYLRALVEKWVPTLPFVSSLYTRIGQVVGTPENCRRLLAAEEAILVFPEGVRGLNKPFSKRYQLQSFGSGFMRLALEAGAPIIPVGVVFISAVCSQGSASLNQGIVTANLGTGRTAWNSTAQSSCRDCHNATATTGYAASGSVIKANWATDTCADCHSSGLLTAHTSASNTSFGSGRTAWSSTTQSA